MKYISLSFLFFNMVSFMRAIRFIANPMTQKQYIIKNKEGNCYYMKDSMEFMKEARNVQEKPIITISPGGFYGFYMMGVCTYMKDYYNMDKYIYSGASAGAWNSLFMTFNKHQPTLVQSLVQNDLYKGKNIYQVEQFIKHRLLEKYDASDFDLDRLFIGVTTIGQTNIYTDFHNLEDAIDCCIASSHIPFISGNAMNKYKNIYTFDGGFSNYPYLNVKRPILHINPLIWNNKTDKTNKLNYAVLFKENFNLEKLFERGYEDTRVNRDTLKNLLA